MAAFHPLLPFMDGTGTLPWDKTERPEGRLI
jgi:hypothetical protein